MDWLKDYRQFIREQAHRLRSAGLSFLGEDDSSMTFLDEKVSITFSVEPFSEEPLAVQVEYLSGAEPDDQVYFLDVLMALTTGQPAGVQARSDSAAEHERVVKDYVDFIVRERGTLFQSICPLAQAYARVAQASEDAALAELETIRRDAQQE